MTYVLPSTVTNIASQHRGKPGLSLGFLDSLGSALEHSDGGKLNPCSVPHLRGLGCTYMDLRVQPRKRHLQAQGIQAWGGLGAALVIETLRRPHSSYCKDICYRNREGEAH